MKQLLNHWGGGKVKLYILGITLLLLITGTAESQVVYNFGQTGGTLTGGTGTNPSVFNYYPVTPTNVAFYYGFSAGANSMIKGSNAGLLRLGDSTEAQACAGNGANQFTKFGILRYSAQGTLFSYIKFDVVFAGDSLANTNSDNGVWYFFIGDGGTTSQFMANDTISKKLGEAGVSLRWTFTTNGGLTFARYDYNSASWVDITGMTWSQKKKYTVEVYANTTKLTTSQGNVIYTRQGVADTLAGKTMSVYVNNYHLAHDVNVSQFDNQTLSFKKMDSYCWYGEGSNTAWIFVDNSAAADAPPTTYAYYTVKPANGTNLNLSLLSSWTSSYNGVGGTAPTSFSVSNSTWFIRNYNGATGVTFTVSDSLDITGGSNSQYELGDSGQVASLTLPTGKKIKGDLDVRGYGDLVIQSVYLPTIRTTDLNSTVEYNNGDNNITYPLYYNLKIHAGTKTIGADYIIDGKATVGNGTNSATLVVPSNRMFIGTVDVKNNGKLTIQNSTYYPTLGTLETGSTVEYNGTGLQTMQSGQTFHHLIVNNPAGVVQNGDATVNGTMTMTSGNHDINGKTLTFTGNVAGSGGTFKGSSSSRLFVTGTGALGTLSFTNGSRTLKKFSVNRNTSGSVTLGSYLNVTDTLTLSDGILNINSSTDSLTLGTSTSSPGVLEFTQTQNYTAWINGKLQRYINAGAGNGNSNAIVFPMGSSLQWGGLRLYYTASGGATNGGTLSAKFTTGDPGSVNTGFLDDGGYTIDRYSKYAYWTVKNSAVTGTYEINIDAYSFTGLNTDSAKRLNLRVLKRADSSSPWTLQGSHSPGSGDMSRWTAKRTGLTTFSDFTLGAYSVDNELNNGILPVSLESFSSSVTGRNITLNWITSSETNNAGFEIHRTNVSNGTSGSWEKAGYVTGKGNSSSQTSYKFEEKNLNTGKYKYRLKQIDYNGSFVYFELGNTIEISAPAKYDISQNYPNPFNPATKIDFALPFDSRVKVVVYDITGREMKTVLNESRTAGYYTITFDGSSLSSGVYFYHINAVSPNTSFSRIKKMVFVK